jgi:hypothetical protein
LIDKLSNRQRDIRVKLVNKDLAGTFANGTSFHDNPMMACRPKQQATRSGWLVAAATIQKQQYALYRGRPHRID